MGITMLVGLTGKEAKEAKDFAALVLEQPPLALSVADQSAGEWDADAAVALAEQVRGLCWERQAKDRSGLATVLTRLEQLHAQHRPLPLSVEALQLPSSCSAPAARLDPLGTAPSSAPPRPAGQPWSMAAVVMGQPDAPALGGVGRPQRARRPADGTAGAWMSLRGDRGSLRERAHSLVWS